MPFPKRERHYLLIPLEQLTGLQQVKKFPAFHGTRRFITALTSVRHLSLSWASPIQSIYTHPTSYRSILILSTNLRLGLPSGLFPSGFPTKTLYTPLSSPISATCPTHLILLDFIGRSLPHRKSCRWWRNVGKYCRPGHATDDNIIWHMRFACWITKATLTHTHTHTHTQNM